MQYIQRKCCICEGSNSRHAVCAQEPAESLEFTLLKDQWNGFFHDKKKSFFSYHLCPQCQLLFCPQFFSDDQLNHLYANMPDNTANVPMESLEKTQHSYFKAVRNHIPFFEGDYFEMGPDIGLFTQDALRYGKFKCSWLAEPNQSVWDTLKKKFSHVNMNLFSDLIADDPIPNDTIKLAVMIHVLDHLLDPRQALQHLRRKMKKNAIVLIVTHDESSLLAKILNHRWPAYCLQHPQLYRPESMKKLLESSGFEVVQIKKSYNHFPLGYLLNHLLWALGFKKFKFPLWNRLQLPLKLGNIITIASVK